MTGITGGSLTKALNSTLSGSQVQSAKMSVLGRNINNIGVEGARAQKVVASTIAVNGQSIGVEVAKVVRQVDMAYLLNAQKIKTNLEGAEVSKDFLDRVTQIFGSPKSKSAPGNLIAQFESAVEALSRNPSDGSLQFKLVQSTANKFTTTMN